MSEIIGLEDVLKKLKKLPEKIQKRVVTGAIRAGSKPIIQEAKNLVPTKTGTLKKSISVVKRRSKDKNIVHFSIVPKSKIIWKELSKNKKPKFLVSKVTGRRYLNIENYAGHVELGRNGNHPHPFMRPAFEKKGEESIKFVRDYMRKRLDKELAR